MWTVAPVIGADVFASVTRPESWITGPSGTRKTVVLSLVNTALVEKYSSAETQTYTSDCCISVKLKLPDTSVVVDSVSAPPGPLRTETVAPEIGSLVRLAMTCPVKVDVARGEGGAEDGPDGDSVAVSLPLHANTGRMSNGMHKRRNDISSLH